MNGRNDKMKDTERKEERCVPSFLIITVNIYLPGFSVSLWSFDLLIGLPLSSSFTQSVCFSGSTLMPHLGALVAGILAPCSSLSGLRHTLSSRLCEVITSSKNILFLVLSLLKTLYRHYLIISLVSR